MGRYVGNNPDTGVGYSHDWVHLEGSSFRHNADSLASTGVGRISSVGFNIGQYGDEFNEYKFVTTNMRCYPNSSNYGKLKMYFNAQIDSVGGLSTYNSECYISNSWYMGGQAGGGSDSYASQGTAWGANTTINVGKAHTYGSGGWKNEFSRFYDFNGTSLAGELILYRPHDTTYQKFYEWRGQGGLGANGNSNTARWVGGYIKSATAVIDVKFSFELAAFYSFNVQLYGWAT